MMNSRGKQSRKDVLAAIVTLSEETGIPPTLREIGGHTRLSLAGTQYLVDSMMAEGMVTYQRGHGRTLVVTPRGMRFLASR